MRIVYKLSRGNQLEWNTTQVESTQKVIGIFKIRQFSQGNNLSLNCFNLNDVPFQLVCSSMQMLKLKSLWILKNNDLQAKTINLKEFTSVV